MNTKRKTAMEIGMNLFFISIVLLMFVFSSEYEFINGTLLGARTFPMLVGIIMTVFILYNIINAVKKYFVESKTEVEQIDEKQNGTGFQNLIRRYRVGVAVGLMAVYYLFLVFAGFIISTVLFIPAILYLLEYRKPGKVILVTVVGVSFLYIVFRILLGVPLPAGMLFK